MRLRNSIITIAILSSMSFAGGDIGGVTSFENDDYQKANEEVVPYEPTPIPEAQEVISTPIPTAIPTVESTREVPTAMPTTAPAVTPKPTPKVVEKSSSGVGGFYVGLAVSDMGVRADDRVNLFSSEKHQDLQKGLTLVAGYDFMKYLGAELRAALSLAGEGQGQDNLAEYGVYLKPQYPVLDNLNIYGLLGYSAINMSDPATKEFYDKNKKFDGDNSGFSFGGGINYGITSNISVFTDVVNYLRDFGGSNSTWGANLGVRYNF